GPGGPGGPGGPNEAVVIDLDRDVILKELVPTIVEKHFSSHDETAYRVAVARQGDQPMVLYSSAGEWTPEDIAMPDYSVSLFGTPPPPGGGGGGPNRRGGRNRGPGTRGGIQGFLISPPWQFLAKHR